MSSSSARSSAPTATAIGRYRLRACLASGATGHVYLADDPATGTQVAVKVLAADLQDEPETRERFYREARILTELTHPNIVRVLDIGEEQGRPFIAMELLDGLGLADHLRAHPDLPLSRRIDLIEQLYAGLDAAHAQGTVHRDVKPANLIVQADGRLKIFDFGLARLHESTLTANGAVVGSPGYMSPEQVEGRRVDQRSDIFSAAAVGYLILSGRAPFEARNLPLVLDAVLNEPPAALSNAEAPAPLAHVLLKALEKLPEARYQSCAELLVDLQRVHNTVVHS